MELFCLDCNKEHMSSTWYYRDTPNERQWLCGLKYLILDPEEMDLWRMYPFL